MEKKTKKRKTKRLRRRIGIIAVGGLSLVLTVCLSVGATLAWFAGSSWASKSMFMGGPVYVEMAGRGAAGATAGDGTNTAKWVGGDGSLDIKAAASRTSGTRNGSAGTGASSDGDPATPYNTTGISDNVLLPGQKVQIYSQARVFSTLETNSTEDIGLPNQSSGANTTNTSNGTVSYTNNTGRVTTTTTSVLRARFNINVEFDPSVGFNNFTDAEYMENYPVQSTDFAGDHASGLTALTWEKAWGNENAGDLKFSTDNPAGTAITYGGRRDGLSATQANKYMTVTTGLTPLKDGSKKSIYKWKYVSETIYKNTATTAADVPTTPGDIKYVKMGAPFDGSDKTSNANGFYGVWILDSTGTSIAESDAFYKDRCNAYLESYVEHYVNEYGNGVERSISSSLAALDTQLNQYFVKLVNDSSNNILSGNTDGFTVDNNGRTTQNPAAVGVAHNASWLYIDPTIGNDTNTNELSTTTGGWWYLVESTGLLKATDPASGTQTVTDNNAIATIVDSADTTAADLNQANSPAPLAGDDATFKRADIDADDVGRLNAKLHEIVPNIALGEKIGNNNGTDVTKVVSDAFPFVNGTFALPGDALTNVFANAKISFQISFQALQAFFPYTEDIDKITYNNALLGTAKALNIKNAIPVFNEAFDYQEGLSNSNIEGL